MSAADLTAAGLGLWQPEGPSASYDLSWQKETNADSHVRRDTAIFIDHTSTVLGFEQFCKEHDLPNSARIDFESFAHFLQESTTEPLDVSTRRIAASAPLEERHREELTDAKYEVDCLERIIQRKGKALTTREQAVAEVLALHIAVTVLEMPEETKPAHSVWPPRIVLVTGDGGHLEYLRGGFTRIIHSALHKGFAVAVWSFKSARSERWQKLYVDVVREGRKGAKVGRLYLMDLDDYADIIIGGVRDIEKYIPAPKEVKKPRKKKQENAWGTVAPNASPLVNADAAKAEDAAKATPVMTPKTPTAHWTTSPGPGTTSGSTKQPAKAIKAQDDGSAKITELST